MLQNSPYTSPAANKGYRKRNGVLEKERHRKGVRITNAVTSQIPVQAVT